MRSEQGDGTGYAWLRVALSAAVLLACVLAVFHVGPNLYLKNVTRPAHQAVRLSPQAPHPSSGMRPVYPFSVIPGGAYTAAELRNKLRSDAVAARHYQKFRLNQVSSIQTESASLVYVSYRKGSSIYWTRRPVRLARGEKLLTDGVLYARARCGNRISTTPEGPVALLDPPDYIFERPETWQPNTGRLPPPPPVESKSRTPEIVAGLPFNPARETVAKKRLPFFPLFPFWPIGGGGGGSHGNGGTVVTRSGGGSGSKGGSVGGTGSGTGGGTPGNPGAPGGGVGVGGGNPGGPGGGGGTGGNPGGPGGGPGGGNPGGPGGGPDCCHPGGGGGGNPPPPPPEVSEVPEPNAVLLLLAAMAAIGGTHYWKSKPR